MTREEEINKAAKEYFNDIPHAFDSYKIAFAMGAQWSDKSPHWISVEDELPEDDTVVLVYYKVDDDSYVMTSMPFCCSRFDMPGGENVTHWMSLPKAPKKGCKQ